MSEEASSTMSDEAAIIWLVVIGLLIFIAGIAIGAAMSDRYRVAWTGNTFYQYDSLTGRTWVASGNLKDPSTVDWLKRGD